jgi:hypothetical protein
MLMTDEAEKRGQLIRHLEEALALADEIEDGQTGLGRAKTRTPPEVLIAGVLPRAGAREPSWRSS